MKSLRILTVCSIVLVLVLSACNVPRAAVSYAGDVAGILVTLSPDATPTPTPFRPVANTPTIPGPRDVIYTDTPEPTVQVTRTASPSQTPTSPALPNPEGVTKILVLGSDYRPGEGYRTDVIMLVILNADKRTVSVVSFPRDLWVTIPGYYEQRINVAQAVGGFQLMADTLEYNFGVRPDHYVLTNMQGFQQIVDSLGGINVYASQNLTDECSLPIATDGWCSFGPGSYRMDGATALWYVRSRHSTSDFDRTRRAQEVMQGLFSGLMSLNAISRIPELYSLYKANVETDLGVDTVVTLASMAPDIATDSSRIHRYAVGPTDVYSWVTPGGAQVLLPNYANVQGILWQALSE